MLYQRGISCLLWSPFYTEFFHSAFQPSDLELVKKVHKLQQYLHSSHASPKFLSVAGEYVSIEAHTWQITFCQKFVLEIWKGSVKKSAKPGSDELHSDRLQGNVLNMFPVSNLFHLLIFSNSVTFLAIILATARCLEALVTLPIP